MSLSLTLEFSGGAELLFDKQKRHDVILPARSDKWNIQVNTTLQNSIICYTEKKE